MTGSQGPQAASGVGRSDVPELTEVRVGFIALTDCASLVVASTQGFDRRHGIRLVLSRQPSWAAVRDKLLSGQLHAAHALYGLVLGVQTGIGGVERDMAVLMTLNQNGQAITLSRQLVDRGVSDGASLAALVEREPSRLKFAQTFPTGTHAMWLNYWLAAHDIDPRYDVRITTVPPPQMVEAMRQGEIQGFCAGEPWNQLAISEKVGFTVATSQQVWPGHPEKVLATTAAFVAGNPNAARALTAAVLEASRWIEASEANRRKTAALIAQPDCVAVPEAIITPRMTGEYSDGCGRSWHDPERLKFFDGGQVNFPYLSDAMWFLTQQRRWGLLGSDPDYLAVARAVNRIDVYRDAAAQIGVSLPAGEMRSARLMDGTVWDGSDPNAYAASFAGSAVAA